jgi:hypothetical protein
MTPTSEIKKMRPPLKIEMYLVRDWGVNTYHWEIIDADLHRQGQGEAPTLEAAHAAAEMTRDHLTKNMLEDERYWEAHK